MPHADGRADFGRFVPCLAGPGETVSDMCDLLNDDRDGTVDVEDVGAMQRAFTGP